jgi:hypothetical protein
MFGVSFPPSCHLLYFTSMGFGTKSPPPPPSAELVGAIIGGHTAIFALCYLIYGSQRYVAPVMGGTSKKNKADVGSLKAQVSCERG